MPELLKALDLHGKVLILLTLTRTQVLPDIFPSRPRVEEPGRAVEKDPMPMPTPMPTPTSSDRTDSQKYDQVADRLKPLLLKKGASWLSAMVNNSGTGMRRVLLRKLIEDNRFGFNGFGLIT